MKYFAFPLLLVTASVLAQNFLRLPVFSNPWAESKSSCKTLRKSIHRYRYPHPKSQPNPYPYAPIFDPYSPALAAELMAVFGHDSLADRTQRFYNTHQVKRKFGMQKAASKAKTAKAQRATIQSIISNLSKQLPFQSDLNLGSNSDTDVYVEVNASKDWQLNPSLDFNTQQTFRYGAQSRNYSETNFNFTQKQQHQAIASSALSVTKTYDDTYNWENHLFRKQKINHDQSLTYGLYSNGIYNKEKRDIELQNWGPYVAWRRPLWRTWLYLENELSYYQDRTNDNKGEFSTNIQFEMAF
ncbi:hypothetical protein [Acinetobacter sp. MD2]|uniref:hypothetical protein n=1 Tax=Acinetobacter sp. MD2 TaxID=2600066 RepID=UPI002D1EF9C8|nr:hypothetical protein [Acinetobacter sp. MD2]MEB3767309.1 hypothetical protein [Acinetobacter sp. MD2]